MPAVDPSALSAPILPQYNPALETARFFAGKIYDEQNRRQLAAAANKKGFREHLGKISYWHGHRPYFVQALNGLQNKIAKYEYDRINPFDEVNHPEAWADINNLAQGVEMAASASDSFGKNMDWAYRTAAANPDKFDLAAYRTGMKDLMGLPFDEQVTYQPDKLLVAREQPVDFWESTRNLAKNIGEQSSTIENGDRTVTSKKPSKQAIDNTWSNFKTTNDFDYGVRTLTKSKNPATGANFTADEAERAMRNEFESRLSSEYKSVLDEEKKGNSWTFGAGSASGPDIEAQYDKYQVAGTNAPGAQFGDAIIFRGKSGANPKPQSITADLTIDVFEEDASGNTKKDKQGNPIKKGVVGVESIDDFVPVRLYIDPANGKIFIQGNGTYENEEGTKKSSDMNILVDRNNKKMIEYKFLGGQTIEDFMAQAKGGSAGAKKTSKAQIKDLVGKPGYEGYTEQELIDYYKSQGYEIE